MSQNYFRQLFSGLRGYLWENWGAPFIVAFMVLLMAAAALSLNLSALAEELAVYAYYALIAGVVLQLVCFLECRRKNSSEATV